MSLEGFISHEWQKLNILLQTQAQQLGQLFQKVVPFTIFSSALFFVDVIHTNNSNSATILTPGSYCLLPSITSSSQKRRFIFLPLSLLWFRQRKKLCHTAHSYVNARDRTLTGLVYHLQFCWLEHSIVICIRLD